MCCGPISVCSGPRALPQFATSGTDSRTIWPSPQVIRSTRPRSTSYRDLGQIAQALNRFAGYTADIWTTVTAGLQKGWNTAIGFLAKSFLRLHGLVDIAGDVAIKVAGVLVDSLPGIENAWVETVDYLADTWSEFVSQVKQMWNSAVGFLRKAWVKLKSLIDDDINVDVEMAKIERETATNNAAEEQKKQQAISDRMQRRQKRKADIEQRRQEMQKGLQRKLEERRKSRDGRDIDAEAAIIDEQTASKNAAVDVRRDEAFDQNQQATDKRSEWIDQSQGKAKSFIDESVSKQPGSVNKDNSRWKLVDANGKVKSMRRKRNSTWRYSKPTRWLQIP